MYQNLIYNLMNLLSHIIANLVFYINPVTSFFGIFFNLLH